jgi:uncharacterized membrane protein YgcG
LFRKPVFDPVTKETKMMGDVNNTQITRVCLKSYINELPIPVGLESFELHGNLAPRIIANGNGRLVTAILLAESAKEFQNDGVVLHENPNVYSTDMVNSWAGVTEAMLREHSERHQMTGNVSVNIDANRHVRFLLNKNLKHLVREFRDTGFNERDLFYQLEKHNRDKKPAIVQLPSDVYERLIETGIRLGVNPVSEITVPLSTVGFRPVSLTSENGGFADLKTILTHKYGADHADDLLERVYDLAIVLEIEAVVAGTDSKPALTSGTLGDGAGHGDSGSESEGHSSGNESGGGGSGQASGASSDAE